MGRRFGQNEDLRQMGSSIADTSIWVDYLNGILTPKVEQMKKSLIEKRLYICPVIVQEILQGIRDDKKHASCQYSISVVPILEANMWDASTGAASIYRKLRKSGITIRKPNDCLIAWYAIAFDLTLIHNDRDFDNISRHVPLKVI